MRDYIIFMSVAIAHFLLGATISLVIFRLGAKNENYIQNDILVAAIGGFWALIPDIPKLFNIFGHAFEGALSDIFFFHYSLDKLDIMDSVSMPFLIMVLFLLTVLIITPNLESQE